MSVVWLLSALFWGWAVFALPSTGLFMWRAHHDRVIATGHIVLTIIAAGSLVGSVWLLFE